MGDILVLVEHRDHEVDNITLQLMNKGRQLADQLGVRLGAIILGSDIGVVVDAIAGSGADTVFTADHPELAQYNPELLTNTLADILRMANPALLLLGYTFIGMEIGPAISARSRPTSSSPTTAKWCSRAPLTPQKPLP